MCIRDSPPLPWDATTGFPAKWRPRNERRKSVLHDDTSLPRSGKCSWLNLFEPTRSTTQILVVACHERGEAVTTRCHSSKISGSSTSRGPANIAGRKKTIKMTCVTPVHDCTLDQNGRPYFSSIVRQCKWPSLSWTIVEVQEFCYHGNETSQFYSSQRQSSPVLIQFALRKWSKEAWNRTPSHEAWRK